MIHEDTEVLESGTALEDADRAVVMLHGRGATAHSIIQMENRLPEAAFLAPQAANNTWYPRPFMETVESNQPHLESALKKVHSVMEKSGEHLPLERTVLMGFSQGACLASEYAARNPGLYGGVCILSGGLIGQELRDYSGSMETSPVFIGCSENDPHIPLGRVEETIRVFESLDSEMEKHVFEGSHHGVTDYEIERLESMIEKV